MLLSVTSIPLALYIHIPWCVRKCPYCDFNSHELSTTGDHAALYRTYVDALLADASAQAPWLQGRQIRSVFIGGGTPSLLPINEYQRLFNGLRMRLPFAVDCEITMEANPGTLEYAPFSQYLDVGINRLSIGVQSFAAEQLHKLGRIHDPEQAKTAITQARNAGFKRVNVDIMHGLPQQTSYQALNDIQQAHDAGATHLSWYQLTVEPNTVFYRDTPLLPDDDTLADIEEAGQQKLLRLGYQRYEVSAWVGPHDKPCQHNLNYWQFGDYLAIGAGAHGKISLDAAKNSDFISGNVIDGLATQDNSSQIARFSKSRLPKDYLDQTKWHSWQSESLVTKEKTANNWPKTVGFEYIAKDQLPAEFMLNALRLDAGVSWQTFTQHTGLARQAITHQVSRLIEQGLLADNPERLVTTDKGRRYLNQVLYAFI